MMTLDGLLLQARTILRRKRETLVIAIVGLLELGQARLKGLQQ